jgi:PAS domain S-box-containing protein
MTVDLHDGDLVRCLPDLVVLAFGQDLRCRLAVGALRASRWSGEELLGRRPDEVIPAEVAGPVTRRLQAALAGQRQAFEAHGVRDPTRLWAIDLLPLPHPDGETTVLWLGRDVTNLRRSESELREQRRQLAEAQRVGQIGSLELDLTTDRVSASDELLRILGLPADVDFTLQLGLGMVHPADRERVQQAVARARVDPAPFTVKHRVVRPDGEVRTLVARGEGVRDPSGRVVRVVATDQDVTEAERAEQERRRLLARLYEALEGRHQRLAADLHDSHIQSLVAIGIDLDQVRLRLGPNAPTPVRSLLDKLRTDVSAEVSALRRTIAALRPLVLDQRGLVAALRELADGVCLRAALASCEVDAELNGTRLDPGVETILFRVAQQALANVEQHAAARHARVALWGDGPAAVVLAVEDDGRGFDVAHADVAAGQEGFGLTSMRERVQAIGGEMTVDSRPGGGTCIRARVPARDPSRS